MVPQCTVWASAKEGSFVQIFVQMRVCACVRARLRVCGRQGVGRRAPGDEGAEANQT